MMIIITEGSHIIKSTEFQDGTKIILQNICHHFPTSSFDLCSHSDLLQLSHLVLLSPHPTSRLSLFLTFKSLHSFPFFFYRSLLCDIYCANSKDTIMKITSKFWRN